MLQTRPRSVCSTSRKSKSLRTKSSRSLFTISPLAYIHLTFIFAELYPSSSQPERRLAALRVPDCPARRRTHGARIRLGPPLAPGREHAQERCCAILQPRDGREGLTRVPRRGRAASRGLGNAPAIPLPLPQLVCSHPLLCLRVQTLTKFVISSSLRAGGCSIRDVFDRAAAGEAAFTLAEQVCEWTSLLRRSLLRRVDNLIMC